MVKRCIDKTICFHFHFPYSFRSLYNMNSRRINDCSILRKTQVNLIRSYKKRRSINFLKEYTQSSTIHGVQNIFRENETVLHRITWTVLFLISFTGACYMVYKSWDSFINYPVAISVVDTHHPLDSVLFPAISVCPTNKILLSKAMQYLESHISKDLLNDTRIVDFLKAVSLLQHPSYDQMTFFLNKSKPILHELAHIDLADLMRKALPRCEDIFLECSWQGNKKDCCKELFHLQRSEEGFCYSFNSLSAEKYKACSYLDLKKSGCRLRSSSAIGPTTGLEVFVRLLEPNEDTIIEFTGSPKLKVQAHHPSEYPDPGVGTLLPVGQLNKINIGIQPTITVSSDDIRRMGSEIRGCTFKDENIPYLTKTYSQKTCLMECRIKFMISKCGCLPYYFYRTDNSVPVCNATQLFCIVGTAEVVRFFKPPSKTVDEIYEMESSTSLDCQHCLPTCNEDKYEVIMELTKDQMASSYGFGGYIDAFYKTAGAIKYKRDVTYDFIKLLVDMGGIGGLFLGGSLLSILEILYWFSKALISLTWNVNEKFLTKEIKVRRMFVSDSLWYN